MNKIKFECDVDQVRDLWSLLFDAGMIPMVKPRPVRYDPNGGVDMIVEFSVDQWRSLSAILDDVLGAPKIEGRTT